MARAMTNISKPTSIMTSCHNPACITAENAAVDIFMRIKSWGMIMGKPIMAISAACCCALAAMAARKVNTKLRLIPPKQAIPKKRQPYSMGLPNKTVKMAKLKQLITSINRALKINFDNTKSLAPAME